MGLLVRLAIRSMLAPGARPPSEWVRSVTDSLCREGTWTDLECVAQELRIVLEGREHEAVALLERDPISSRPTIVARGEHDSVVGRRELDRLVERLPNGERVDLAGTGHCPQVEAPEAVAELVLRARELARVGAGDERAG
jgi:pimeloyl-ACP methyl ester carboxylesterase